MEKREIEAADQRHGGNGTEEGLVQRLVYASAMFGSSGWILRVDESGKRPHLFTLNGDAPFALAGFWEIVGEISRCCLLTTSANSLLEPIHDRMPVIVRREDWEEWFSPGELADRSFQRIMTPYLAEEMSALAVSPVVNSARVDDPRCCEPVESSEGLQKLEITRQQPRTDQQTLGL